MTDTTALLNGQAGIDVANQVFANVAGPDRFANGIALIESAAAEGAVSPVRSLLSFTDRLNQLDGDGSHFTAVGVELAGLVASGDLEATAAVLDFLPAVNALQIGRAEAASVLIAMANSGALDVQLMAGCYLGQLTTPFGGEGGGGSWPGGNLRMTTAVQTIHNGVVGGSLGETQAYGLLAGLTLSPFSASDFGLSPMSELRTLIGGDADALHDVIDIFIDSIGIISFTTASSVAGTIMSLLTPFSTPDLSFSELASHVHTAATVGTLTDEQAIAMMARFARSYDYSVAAANDVATAFVSLVDDGFMSQEAMLDALTGGGASTAARFLVAVAAVDPDAAPAAGLRFATLIDTTSPTFMVPNNKMTAQQALNYVSTGVSLGGLSGASAVALLTAMAFVPGGLTPDRNAMNVAADGVRTLVGSDAAAFVVDALAPLGFTPEQGVTFLIALGASGNQQIFGSSVIWVNDAALAAAASAAIAGLIHDHGLSAAAIGAALDGVFPLGADDVQLAVSTLLRAAPTLAALELDAYTIVGAALAQAANVSLGLAMGQVNDRMLGNELSAEALIAILAGFAGAGNAADQVGAGRQFISIVDWASLSMVDAMVELDTAVAAGALTHGQAIVFLAGTATSSLPIGLADQLAQIAAYMNADPAAGAGALGGAVSANALSTAQGLYVLTWAAALGSAATAAAVTDVLLSWVEGGIVTADDLATQLLGLAQGEGGAVRAVAGANIAALIGDGALSAQAAIALIDGAVPSTLDAHTAIVVLAHMAAAGDAALQEAVQLDIAFMIGNGDITLQAAIIDLQAMLPGASAALQAVLDAQLAILLTDPATLAQTAGLGSPAQVQAAAVAIALLFSTDPTAAQGILDAVSDRTQNGDLTPQQTANLLARIYDQGGDATTPVLAAIDDLTPGHIATATMADAIVAQSTAGGLSAVEVFAVFGPLSAVDAAAVNGAVAGLVSSGVITVSTLDAAVDGGHYSDANAIAVLRSVMPGAAPALRAEALAEIQALVSANTALAAQALPTFIQLAVSSDHDLRIVGREGIEALATAAPGVGSAAFLQLLSYLPIPDTAFLADLRATLVALLNGGYLTTAEAIQHIDDQLSPSNPSPLINAFQAVDILVALSAVDGARTAIYEYIRQQVANNSVAQAVGPSHPMWPFTAQPVIAALARGTVEDLDHVEQTALVIVNISAILSTSQIVTGVAQGSIALMAVVAGFINRTGAMTEFGSHLAGRIGGLPPSEQVGSLGVISSLIGDTVDDLQLSDAVELLLAIHAAGAEAAALAELADIGSPACFFIMGAITSGSTTLANGVEAMAALATSGAPGFDTAVATFLGDLLTGGQFTPAAVMSALEAAVADDVLTAQEMVALLQDVLVARMDPADLPATAALQSTILAEIDALSAANHVTFAEAVAAMAESASGLSSAMLSAIGGEIAAFVGGHTGSEQAAVADILAASANGAISGAEALGLLVGTAAWGAVALQVAAGGGIAALVAAGSVATNTAAGGIFNAYLDGGLSLDDLVVVTAGLWANGGTAVGAEVLYQIASQGFDSYGDLADRLAIAVDAGMLSVGDMVDGGVAVALLSGNMQAGANFLAALVSQDLMAADEAVAALGASISPSGLSAGQAAAVIAHLVANLPGSPLLGVGLAEIAIAGQLTLAEATAGLADLLAAGTTGLEFADVATVLIGAATVTEVAAQAGAELVALIGSDDQRLADVLDRVGDALEDGPLTPAGAVALMVGIAATGTQSQQATVGAALDNLVQAGTIDLGTVVGRLGMEVVAGHMDGGDAVFVLLQVAYDPASIEQVTSFINYLLGQESLSANDAAGAILAAVGDNSGVFAASTAVDLLINLSQTHVQAPVDATDRAVIIQAGAALASLVAADHFTADGLLAQLAWPPFGVVPLLAAIEAAAGAQSALGQGARAAILSHLTDAQPYDVVQYVGQLIAPQGLTATQSLPILVDIAIHGGVQGQVAAGQVFAHVVAAGSATMADVHDALSVPGLALAQGAMILAGMIDLSGGTIPMAVLSEIMASFRLPAGSDDYRPYVQPVIAALSDAVHSGGPVFDAQGLSLAQAVLALSVYARFDDPGVRQDVGAAIAALIEEFTVSPDATIALLGRALVADTQGYGVLAAAQIAEVGSALGLTPAQLAHVVMNGTAHGLTASDAVGVLARLTAYDSASYGGVSAAAIGGLTDDHLTAAQAMDMFLGLANITADQMVPLLVGVAGAGNAADQIAVGRAIANLPDFDLSLLSQIADAVVENVALGIASSGSPSAPVILGPLFLIAGAALDTATMALALEGAVSTGALSAADGLRALVNLTVDVSRRMGDDALALRTDLHEALVAIVEGHLGADEAIDLLLTLVPATGWDADKMRAEVGGMLAALADAGLASAATITAALADALGAGTVTGAAVAAFITGAAINREYTNPFPDSRDFAAALGNALGELIEAGSVAVGDAMAGVLATQTWFRMAWYQNEVTLLAAVAGHDAPGLQTAVGHALAALFQSGQFDLSTGMPAFDAMLGAPDGLTAQQAMPVLFAMADGFEGGLVGLYGVAGIAAEFAALCGRGALTAQEVADGVTAEIAAGHVSPSYGIALLTYLASNDGAFSDLAVGEIVDLLAGTGLTIGQVFDGLLIAPRDVGRAVPDAVVDSVVIRIIEALEELGVVSHAEAVAGVMTAESNGRISATNAAGVLLGLAGTADEAGLALVGNALGELIAGGLDPTDVNTILFQSLQSDLVEAVPAASVIAYAMGAITGLPNADGYHYAFGSILAQAAPGAAVGAVDRAYEAGATDAHDVVGLLTWMHGVAGPDARWAIGPELWKMHQDGGIALADIFEQIVATTVASMAWTQGALIAVMAATAPTDDAQQVAFGHALGGFIVGGGMTIGTALSGVGLGGLTDGQVALLILSVAGAGGVAEELGVGQHFGLRLAATLSPNADPATVALFHLGVAAGALTVPELVGVLIGVGMVQSSSAAAVRTSVYALDALVTSGRITAEDAMTLVDGMVPALDPANLVHWLANLSASPVLHDAVAAEIVALLADGVLGVSQALGYIADVTNTWIPGDTAAHLVVSIAGRGDVALQDAVGTFFAEVLHGSQLSEIAAAVTNGNLSPEGAVHVIANLLAALASDPSATVRNWAASQLDRYVDDGLVDAQTVSSVLMDATAHATTTGLISLGAIMGTLGGGLAAIHDAIADGSLSAEQGLDLLLAIGAVRDIGDPVFQAARDEIVALIQDGALTGAQVLAVTRAAGAAGWLDDSHVEVIAFSIFGDGSAADDAAVGAYAATRVDHLGDQFGVGDDAYFTGILAETGLTFLKVQNGQMTAAAAIAHIKEYAAEHDVSAYAGVFVLEGLFGRYQNFSARQLAHDEGADMIALGGLAAELAGRVAEGTTSAYVRSAQGGTQLEAADPNALTRAEALQVLNWEAGLVFTQDQVALARYMFANDLWVAQQVRLDSSPTSPISMTNVVNGMLPGNPNLNTFPDVGRSGYAYDLALVSLLEQVMAPDRVPDQQDYRIALEALSTRLTKGIAQDALISQYVAGNLTFAQVLEALDTQVAATGLGPTPAHQQLMHSMSLAWLNLRAREYIAEHPGTGGAIEAAQFMQQLRDPQYGDELLTGYGALLAMSSSGANALVTSLEKQAAYEEAFSLIRSRTPANLPLSDRDQAVLDALIPMANGMQWALDQVPIGRAFLTVGEDPTDAAAYARLGAHVGTIFANKLAVDALFAHTPWGAAITAAKFGAQVGLFVLSMGAVQDALGEGPTLYLRGQLTMAGATASLLGDTISDLGQAGAEIVIQSAPHFIEFSDAVSRGDAEGIASSIGEIAMDYYKLQTGVDLRLYGAVGERFADLMVHLFTGDTGALGDDVRALGAAYLDTIIQNPYLAAIGERMVEYAHTINGALSDINDSYRILGQNALTGLLLVGTRLDDAGNALRDVAHKVGGFFTDILSGLGIDGYISGATVFADANFNGVLDAGELSTTTDASGRYSIAANGAPLVLRGGFDIATNLPFTGTMLAPAGSTVVTPLTTLIQQVAASTTGDPVAAQQLVASALGLNASIDLNDFDPITATRTGVAGAADAFATASSVLNTVSLLQAAGATDAYEALAARIVAARTLDLTDTATIMAVAASAGVSAGITSTVAQLATASNVLAEQAAASASDPMRFMRYVTAVSIAAQGDTSHDLAAAGSNAAQLADVLAQHTGSNLANQVSVNRTQVGGFGDNGSGGGEVPLQISADGRGIELALGGGSTVAGNWVRLAASDTGLHAGATVVVYAVDSSGNVVDHDGIGGDLTVPYATRGSVGGVEDDDGGRMLLGSQAVYLAAGEQLRFAVLSGNQGFDSAPSTQLAARGDGSLQVTIDGLHLTAVTNNSMTAATTLAEAQRDTGDAFVFLRQGETLSVELAGSSANANTLGFVRVDINAATGERSVAGVAYGNTAAFTEAVRSHMDGGFHQTHGGDFAATASWTVAGATGYYAPVLIGPNGQIFVVGTANSDGQEHIRVYGENTFGFEDLAAHQGSDFDYNDMVMRLHSTRGDFS